VRCAQWATAKPKSAYHARKPKENPMTPKGKKIWNSQAGARLMRAMLGEKPVTKQDGSVIKDLVDSSKAPCKSPRRLNNNRP